MHQTDCQQGRGLVTPAHTPTPEGYGPARLNSHRSFRFDRNPKLDYRCYVAEPASGGGVGLRMSGNSIGTMPSEDYIRIVIREFKRSKTLADGAIAQLSLDGLFTVPADGDNSVAVIIKHVSGNMRSRWKDFLSSDGEKPDQNRDAEFVILPEDSRESLLMRWEEAWAILFAALEPLGPSDLHRTATIRGESLTVLQAMNRQLTHYAYHVGQIVYVAKHLAGHDWKSLSIPLGASRQFNHNPTKYIERA